MAKSISPVNQGPSALLPQIQSGELFLLAIFTKRFMPLPRWTPTISTSARSRHSIVSKENNPSDWAAASAKSDSVWPSEKPLTQPVGNKMFSGRKAKKTGLVSQGVTEKPGEFSN